MSRLFRLDRALAPGEPLPRLSPGLVLALDPHRFGRVLRLVVDEVLTLADASGAMFSARCVSADPPRVEILELLPSPPANPRHALEVWLPLLKGGKSEDLVRPLVELGATRIVPFSSQHAVVRLDARKAAARRERLQAIADESCQQCGRSDQPRVELPVDHLPRVGPGLFLWEVAPESGPTVPASEPLSSQPPPGTLWDPSPDPLRLLSGPEGGLSRAEADALVALGWRPLWLGPRILRAETAVIALATMAQLARGELPWPPSL